MQEFLLVVEETGVEAIIHRISLRKVVANQLPPPEVEDVVEAEHVVVVGGVPQGMEDAEQDNAHSYKKNHSSFHFLEGQSVFNLIITCMFIFSSTRV
jgi:rRNA pseudouridine-1189 N-methylase Emg1 (Nep1/Mra1 family)